MLQARTIVKIGNIHDLIVHKCTPPENMQTFMQYTNIR